MVVPLGQRRRFGPAPAEETAPPQLAQPSPSAYPRASNQDNESPGKRGREESPGNGDPKGKLDTIVSSIPVGAVGSLLPCVTSSFGDSWQLWRVLMCITPDLPSALLTIVLTLIHSHLVTHLS